MVTGSGPLLTTRTMVSPWLTGWSFSGMVEMTFPAGISSSYSSCCSMVRPYSLMRSFRMTYWALRTSRPVTSSITPSSDPAETTTWITRSLLRLLPSLGS